MTSDIAFSFGPFLLVPTQRRLQDGEATLHIGSRAFDILTVLVEHGGEIVSNEELVARVWANAVVAPGSLRVHVAALRKALGDSQGHGGQHYIINVPLKGYSFVAPVVRKHLSDTRSGQAERSANASVLIASTPQSHALPPQLSRAIGRGELIDELVRNMPQRRCIALVGPGGIGKTTVALAVARLLTAQHAYRSVYAELAPLSSPELISTTLASALGLATAARDPIPGIMAYLRDKRMLIVLDNCEHLVAAVASLTEKLLRAAADVHVLVTSREPLRIEGEWVQRLPSLSVPPPTREFSAAEALSFPSVELFAERAAAGSNEFHFSDREAAAVCEICRRLDGIPLAIELAAASVDQLGVRGVAENLQDRLSFLKRGRRTALPRQQTLRATLDWSHDLLAPSERRLFRCLSAFKSRFTLDSAMAVCAVDDPNRADFICIPDGIAGLVTKSLVAADVHSDPVEYWLLETTREYATQQLASSGDAPTLARRHAMHMLKLLQSMQSQHNRSAPAEQVSLNARHLDDVRAAITWAFSPNGDEALGVSLTTACAPLWLGLALMADYRQLAERALQSLRGQAQSSPTEEMKLCEAYGHALWQTHASALAASQAFSRSLEVAERICDPEFELRSISGLWLIANSRAAYDECITLARRFGQRAEANGDKGFEAAHDRMMAVSLHSHGQQEQALVHVQRVLARPVAASHTAQNSICQIVDQRVAALTVLARIQWMRGFPDQAIWHAQEALDEALYIDHALSLCASLAMGAILIAMWVGDLELAGRYTQLLMARSTEHSLFYWQSFGECFQQVLDLRSGLPVTTSPANAPSFSPDMKLRICSIEDSLADEESLRRADEGTGGWCMPELLRIKAQRLLESAHGDAYERAESLFHHAIAVAREQQALSWELRSAVSLAQLLQLQRRSAEAIALLSEVLGRFSEGFETANLVGAQNLLDALRVSQHQAA